MHNGYKSKGLGTDLLDSVKKVQRLKTGNNEARLFLRCRADREIHKWYQEKFTGSETYIDRQEITYNMYWTGVNIRDNYREIMKAMEFLVNRTSNFE